MKFHTTVKNGKIVWKSQVQRDSLDRYVSSLEGQKIVVDIDKEKRNRTLPQNSYWHLLVKYISEETGEDFERTRTTLKRRHLKPIHHKNIFGEMEYRLPSTSILTTTEMMELIEKTRADCAFLGIHAPTPEEAGYETEARALQNLSTGLHLQDNG